MQPNEKIPSPKNFSFNSAAEEFIFSTWLVVVATGKITAKSICAASIDFFKPFNVPSVKAGV
jgi:hypothetical protein